MAETECRSEDPDLFLSFFKGHRRVGPCGRGGVPQAGGASE